MIGAQRLFVAGKDRAHQREAVAVHAGGNDPHQHIARPDVRACDQILFICHTDREAGQVIFILRIEARHLCRLAADQRRAGLHAALRHAGNNLRNLLRVILPARDIVQEKQRLAACAGHVIDTHRDTVDSNCIMAVHHEGQLQLRSDTVRPGQKRRMFHSLHRIHRKGT